MRRVFDLIKKYSKTDGNVLIQGESGTGKELVARAIHTRSSRKNGPFVVINCAAIHKSLMERELFGHTKGSFTGASASSIGKIETANTGTVFFDDIDTLDIYMQAKLLRLIQEKEFERIGNPNVHHVDARFIAATNKDLMKMVKTESFREDLYYRLNVLPVKLPALRERNEDVCMLLNYFSRRFAKKTGKSINIFSENTMQQIKDYDWPGNVRELENCVERLYTLTTGSSCIQIHDILDSITNKEQTFDKTLKKGREVFEKEYIEKALQSSNGNRKEAAQKLGIHRNTLLNKIKALEITI